MGKYYKPNCFSGWVVDNGIISDFCYLSIKKERKRVFYDRHVYLCHNAPLHPSKYGKKEIHNSPKYRPVAILTQIYIISNHCRGKGKNKNE